MGIKHAVTKNSGDKGYASEWNDDHIVTSDADFSNYKIYNLGDPTDTKDATNKEYVDASDLKKLYDQTRLGGEYPWDFDIPTLTNYEFIKIVIDVENQNAGTIEARIYFNDDLDDDSYYTQRIKADGTSITGERPSPPTFAVLNSAGDIAHIKATLIYNGLQGNSFIFTGSENEAVAMAWVSGATTWIGQVKVSKINIRTSLIPSADTKCRLRVFVAKG